MIDATAQVSAHEPGSSSTAMLHDSKGDDMWNMALILSIVTVGYNFLEGCTSVWFGIHDETVALFGFGVDSFVEVLSGIGIFHFVRRIRQQHRTEQRDAFERTALRITGGAFYILAAGLVISVAISLLEQHKPVTTFWGVVISLISIASMSFLMRAKLKVGKAVRSQAIIADAHCTKVCLYLSVVLLVASIGFELTGFRFLDAAGSLAIAWFAIKEGRESFEKAHAQNVCSSCAC